jgi:hypothetical protein
VSQAAASLNPPTTPTARWLARSAEPETPRLIAPPLGSASAALARELEFQHAAAAKAQAELAELRRASGAGGAPEEGDGSSPQNPERSSSGGSAMSLVSPASMTGGLLDGGETHSLSRVVCCAGWWLVAAWVLTDTAHVATADEPMTPWPGLTPWHRSEKRPTPTPQRWPSLSPSPLPAPPPADTAETATALGECPLPTPRETENALPWASAEEEKQTGHRTAAAADTEGAAATNAVGMEGAAEQTCAPTPNTVRRELVTDIRGMLQRPVPVSAAQQQMLSLPHEQLSPPPASQEQGTGKCRAPPSVWAISAIPLRHRGVLAAVSTEIYRCNVCSCQEILPPPLTSRRAAADVMESPRVRELERKLLAGALPAASLGC